MSGGLNRFSTADAGGGHAISKKDNLRCPLVRGSIRLLQKFDGLENLASIRLGACRLNLDLVRPVEDDVPVVHEALRVAFVNLAEQGPGGVPSTKSRGNRAVSCMSLGQGPLEIETYGGRLRRSGRPGIITFNHAPPLSRNQGRKRCGDPPVIRVAPGARLG